MSMTAEEFVGKVEGGNAPEAADRQTRVRGSMIRPRPRDEVPGRMGTFPGGHGA